MLLEHDIQTRKAVRKKKKKKKEKNNFNYIHIPIPSNQIFFAVHLQDLGLPQGLEDSNN